MSKLSVKSLVAEYLNSKDESSHQFRRLYRLASLQGVRKFNADICGEFATVLLPVGANGTIPFPADYLDWSMLGIINALGEAVPLKFNENIVTIKQGYIQGAGVEDVPTTKDGVFNSPGGFPLYWLNYQWGTFGYVHLYGVGGGTGEPGQFTVDEINQCFLVQPGYPYPTIVVEYLTNGYDADCGELMINTFASDAFIAWLRWKDYIDQPKKASDSHVRYLKNEFSLEKQAAKLRISKANKDQMQKVYRQNVKLTARA